MKAATLDLNQVDLSFLCVNCVNWKVRDCDEDHEFIELVRVCGTGHEKPVTEGWLKE